MSESPIQQCQICFEDNPLVLVSHHIIPRKADGGGEASNLALLCRNCHELVHHYIRLFPDASGKTVFEMLLEHRDGFIQQCRFCFEKNPIVLVSHHIVPRSRNGSNETENLAVLCRNCHALIHHYMDLFPDTPEETIFKVFLEYRGGRKKVGGQTLLEKLKYYNDLNLRRSGRATSLPLPREGRKKPSIQS